MCGWHTHEEGHLTKDHRLFQHQHCWELLRGRACVHIRWRCSSLWHHDDASSQVHMVQEVCAGLVLKSCRPLECPQRLHATHSQKKGPLYLCSLDGACHRHDRQIRTCEPGMLHLCWARHEARWSQPASYFAFSWPLPGRLGQQKFCCSRQPR